MARSWLFPGMTVVLVVSVVPHGFALSDGFVQHGAVVEFDDANRVTFEAEGRDGSGVAFHVVADDQTTQIVGPFSRDTCAAVSTQVRQVRYAGNKNELWVLSRLGRMLSGAVKIDLRSGKIEEAYEGVSFALSPDGKHIAYVYPGGQPDRFGALFVDDCMVFPVFEKGFTDPYPKSDPAGPAKKSGERYLTYVQEWNRKERMALGSPLLHWVDGVTLELGLESEAAGPAGSGSKGTLRLKLTHGSDGIEGAKGKIEY